MNVGSVCSGIGAPECAWHPLGWRSAFASEIEAFPRAVLAHRFPGLPIHGDFTTIKAGDYEPIDLLVGGTPCQSFSVAGLRKGLADERGNLALEYLRLADRLRPRWVVWENVPGVLSSNGGRDFGAFLGGLVQLGYGFAYRVLDAQYAGVPQRRRRVFVVGYLGDWRRAAAVLFEPHSMQGHPAPRRQKGERVAGGAACGIAGGGETGHCLTATATATGRLDPSMQTFVTGTLCSNGKAAGSATQQDAESGLLIAHTLRASGFDASEDGTGRGTPLGPTTFPWQLGGTMQMPHDVYFCGTLVKNQTQAVAFAIGSHAGAADAEVANRSHAAGGPVGSNISEEIAYSLRAGRQQSVATSAVSFNMHKSGNAGSSLGVAEDRTDCLRAFEKSPFAVHAPQSAVRRLTPRECERLQGFPDDWTLVPYRRGQAADGPRYKALGNSMAVPVMRWIGERIQQQEALLRWEMRA